MDTCHAIAKGTGERCKNEVYKPGARYCGVVTHDESSAQHSDTPAGPGPGEADQEARVEWEPRELIDQVTPETTKAIPFEPEENPNLSSPAPEAPKDTQGEAPDGDFSDGGDLVPGENLGHGDQIPIFKGPEDEPGAHPPELDPELFRELMTPEASSSEADQVEAPGPGPAPQAGPGPRQIWTPAQAEATWFLPLTE